MNLPLPAILLGLAVLLPFFSFWTILFGAKWLQKSAAFVAISAIVGAAVLSFLTFFLFASAHPLKVAAHGAHGHEAHADGGQGHAPHSDQPDQPAEGGDHAHAPADHHDEAHDAHAEQPAVMTGEYYLLGQFGNLRITISYYIDYLTVCMFCMVTFIASCIHFYAMGYMSDELSDITDHEVHLANGEHLHRPGRFPRFFQYLSLFCFSMLGLVLAGNIAMVFCFWELVGICSYFLIGFYVERKSASTAANKAFIVNRVGDFGMILGLMALWSSLGTFAFGDLERADQEGNPVVEKGLFSLVRDPQNLALVDEHHPERGLKLLPPAGMVKLGAREQVVEFVRDHSQIPGGMDAAESEFFSRSGGLRGLQEKGVGYWLLVLGGVGIFCGCVGKSAQFPLHVWLPDAMEGPTPVSALVHSATMVAAGVYLVGRFYPVFTPEVLLVISIIGCITLFLAATIAITATDIKRVLAYSTVSQLGYMMLALGVGGWVAGLMHLITHAFFKSLLFMCSGSVIHAVHTNDMRKMGGLFSKMPVTAITMLIGCLAIAGVGLPFVVGFSGYYSKDAILEQALSFSQHNSSVWPLVLFGFAAGGAAVTAFYMFRMWYLTFVGTPRDHHAYEHAHESPPVMYLPLVVLSVLAVTVAWSTSAIGFAIVPAVTLIYLGVKHHWFQEIVAGGHAASEHISPPKPGHSDHAGDVEETHAHGHATAQGAHTASHADNHGHGHETHGPHAHGSSLATQPQLTWPQLALLILATFVVGGLVMPLVPDARLNLANLLENARPAGTGGTTLGTWVNWTWPDEHLSHADPIKIPVTLLATGTWALGITLATLMYCLGWLNAEEVRRQFSPIYQLLVNKWWFDELYDAIFVRPTLVISRFVANIDRTYIDGFLDFLANVTIGFSRWWDYFADRGVVDGLANLIAGWTYSLGLGLRSVQTGQIRQYVLFIVVGAVAVFLLISFFWTPILAR